MTTALAYDPFNLQHTFPRHPENSARLAGTWNLLEAGRDGHGELVIYRQRI